MAYKVYLIFGDGEDLELDEVYETYEDAEDGAAEAISNNACGNYALEEAGEYIDSDDDIVDVVIQEA